MRSAYAIFICLALKPLGVYCKSSPIHGCEERTGPKEVQKQRHDASTVAAVVGKKAHIGMKQCLLECVALAFLELFLSEDISKQVSQRVSQQKNPSNMKFLKFHNYWMKGFRIDLKTFLDLDMPKQYCPPVRM